MPSSCECSGKQDKLVDFVGQEEFLPLCFCSGHFLALELQAVSFKIIISTAVSHRCLVFCMFSVWMRLEVLLTAEARDHTVSVCPLSLRELKLAILMQAVPTQWGAGRINGSKYWTMTSQHYVLLV